ncbi:MULTISPECIES: nitroreductase family protein [unclassified Actinomyces]|uniref:nitroreductase family protein n=1 Tax=unclassified Actinomyces TaxID=2609248 RepID=UPI0020171E64|nr:MULTISPECIES: nitroreductase family protein [unclassified Actinomyces]MCL3777785.1 nitroreductase family protein [Actinomyces sp. AC-20-1]MCL3789453.1 nitroreductase family protein [Actinomyces sp. 187325]MCL3791756.1 nitroreductase family protein [Actinomyces sp. 186855]MCL3794846.1 nitroreductase family protein [Actinomyces sp. 217892]
MTHQTLTTPPTAPVLNETVRAQLAHRTIRAYTPESVGEDVVETLLEVARHGATSSFQQQVTVIRVLDPAVRAALHASSGQPYVGGSNGELLVFVVDLYRNAVLRERAGADLEPLERTTLFLQGVEDAVIAAQNVVVAAESLGLGTTYLGSILTDVRSVITALGLPERTFPLLGLLVGHAAQEPQYKPRLPREVMSAVDRYPDPAEHLEALAAYDATVRDYYDLRAANTRVDSFSEQIARALGAGGSSTMPLAEVLHEQRLCLS